MRRRVIEGRGPATLALDTGIERITDADRPLLETTDMRMRRAALLGVLHDESDPGLRKLARIADLPACFRVERRAIEHHLARLAGFQLTDCRAALQYCDDTTLRAQPLIPLEQRS